MKNTLAENLLRFNAKNLNSEQTANLKALTEQEVPPSTGGSSETANLYLDYENKRPFKFVVFVNPTKLDKLSVTAKKIQIKVRDTKTQEEYTLNWDPKKPKELILLGKQGAVGAEIVYNKNLTKKINDWYLSTINQPNATYAQANQPEQPNELT